MTVVDWDLGDMMHYSLQTLIPSFCTFLINYISPSSVLNIISRWIIWDRPRNLLYFIKYSTGMLYALVCMSVRPSVCPSVRLSLCLSVRLSVFTITQERLDVG